MRNQAPGTKFIWQLQLPSGGKRRRRRRNCEAFGGGWRWEVGSPCTVFPDDRESAGRSGTFKAKLWYISMVREGFIIFKHASLRRGGALVRTPGGKLKVSPNDQSPSAWNLHVPTVSLFANDDNSRSS
eukprot:3510409-Rhodomonas_salina.2